MLAKAGGRYMSPRKNGFPPSSWCCRKCVRRIAIRRRNLHIFWIHVHPARIRGPQALRWQAWNNRYHRTRWIDSTSAERGHPRIWESNVPPDEGDRASFMLTDRDKPWPGVRDPAPADPYESVRGTPARYGAVDSYAPPTPGLGDGAR